MKTFDFRKVTAEKPENHICAQRSEFKFIRNENIQKGGKNKKHSIGNKRINFVVYHSFEKIKNAVNNACQNADKKTFREIQKLIYGYKHYLKSLFIIGSGLKANLNIFI